LGLNEWAVRIPGATLGLLTVFVLYLVVEKLFKNKNLSLLSALFLAISPWHIHFSRGGWEVNAATFFIVLGLYLFIKAFEKPKYYLWSVISFVFSLYTYHAARVIVPLLGLGLMVIYKREIFKNINILIVPVILGVILTTPLAYDFTKGAVGSRAAGVGLFADPGPLNRINEQRGEHGDFSSLGAKLLHNKGVNYGLAFTHNWLRHYHGLFLFLSGDDIQRNKVPETGQMYLFDLIFLVIGVIVISRNISKEWKLVVWWLIIAPTASALTFQSPHALRSQNMVIPLMIISALGCLEIIKWISKLTNKKYVRFGYLLVTLLIGWQFARYQHMYWIHMSKEYPYSSQYGVKEMVKYVSEKESEYKKVLVTDRYDQPYILFLFYLKYSPEKFQQNHTLTGKDGYGFSTVNNFDKYYFTRIIYDQAIPDNPNSLIVGTPEEITKEANIIKDIYGTNGYKYFRVVAN
jgi:4-amino-4-deoxy-L-arabinose transferase-like glycosyltransferase